MNFISITWELLINLFEVIIYYLYISTILTPKKFEHWKLTFVLLLSLRYFVITLGNTYNLAPTYTIIIAFIFNFLIAKKMFKENGILTFFWVGIHSILGIIGELISYFLLSTFTPMLPNEILFGESYRFPCTTLYIICLATLNFFVSTTVTKKPLFSINQKIFVCFAMIIGIILTHCFMYIMIDLESHQSAFLNVIILANIIFICFFVFLLVYIYELALTMQKNKELQERTKLLEIETAQYNNLLNTTESLRVIKHDIHHHLSTIQTLIENDEVEHIKKYLNEYQSHFDLDYSVATTGNLVIDSIISTKYLIAKRQNTELDFSIMLPETLPFTDVALSALLGNLFDNALEACKKLSIDHRWITFQMKVQEDMLIIHIENSFDGVLKEAISNTYLSRKEEPHHGIGLKRIYTLVEEINGFTEIRHNNNIFTVHIMVPLENTNEF